MTCIGKHNVWDIETEKHHTFFAGGVAVHNCQDFNREFIPIIMETMSHSKWGLTQYTGTPKTRENTLTGLWNRSTQAEWFIPCTHCTTSGFPTWNIPSQEFHLQKIIGPYRDDISPDRPATICHKCRGIIYPQTGRWVHRKSGERWAAEGRHIPQIIMPLHYGDPEKWTILLAKQQGIGNMPANVFMNEVLGEPCDTAAKLVSMTELEAVSNLGPNSIAEAKLKRGRYRMTVLAVDWGGGGEKGVSFTTVAFLGLLPNGGIEVIFGVRLLTPHDHLMEANEIWAMYKELKPTLFAHDYTGAGSLRETFLVQNGMPLRSIMPCMYVRSASQRPCNHIPATPQHPRSHYRIDKSRTLLYTCAAIKQKRLRFFDWDYISMDRAGLISDFLALIEEKVQTMAAGEIFRIDRQEDASDDFAQAVNIGCVAIWHTSGNWPNLVVQQADPLTEEQLKAAAGEFDPTEEGKQGND